MMAIESPGSRVARLSWVFFALPCAAFWGFTLAVFWPGLLSTDSINQWGQLISGHFIDWHPAFHTAYLWLLTRIWFTPAAVAGFQVLVLAALAGWVLHRLEALGVSRGWCWAADALIALSPANATLAISLWKDIPYAISLLALCGLILEIVASRGRWLDGRAHWVLLGLAAALTALFRQNGPLPALGGCLALAVVYRKDFLKKVVWATGLAVVLWAGVRGPMYSALGVESTGIGYSPFIHQIAAHLNAGTAISPDDLAYLNSLYPVANHWNYNCAYVDYTIFSTPAFNWTPVLKSPARLLAIYASLSLKAPQVNLRHMACESAFMWQINYQGNILRSPLTVKANNIKPNWIRENPDGLVQGSLLPNLVAPVSNYIYGLESGLAGRWFTRIVWSPAIALYLMLLLAAALMVRSRSWLLGLPFIPVILQVVGIFLNAGSSDFRYLYPAALAVMLFWPLLLRGGLPWRRDHWLEGAKQASAQKQLLNLKEPR